MSTRAIRGPFRFDTYKIVTTGNYTVVNEAVVVVNKTVGAATTITLPPSAVVPNQPGQLRLLTVIDGKGDCAVNNITVVPAGTDKINGQTSVVMQSSFGV